MSYQYRNKGLLIGYVFFALFISTAANVQAADAGEKASEIVAKTYDIKDVREVVASGGVKLRITQGNTESLLAQAEADLLKQVSVDLTGQRLTLRIKNRQEGPFDFFRWINSRNNEVTFLLQVKSLNYLETSGAVETSLASFNADTLKINLSGASNLTSNSLKAGDLSIVESGASEFDVNYLVASKLKIELSGASNFDVKERGESDTASVNASGASEFDGELLKAASAELEASGASTINIHATQKLSGSASGASTVRYSGQPQSSLTATGASEIEAIK